MRLTMRNSNYNARFHNFRTRSTRNVSDRTIQSESWINISASLLCAGFIKLAGRGLSGVERFIGYIWDPGPATVSRVEIPEKFILR